MSESATPYYQQQLWKIQKARPGRYANSPRVWSDCGTIRDVCRDCAAVRAMFIVGSSEVRVVPVPGFRAPRFGAGI